MMPAMPTLPTAHASTVPSRGRRDDDPESPRPRVVATWVGGKPACIDVPLTDAPLQIGRGGAAGLVLDDGSVSRAHCEIGFDGARWRITDLDSRNGTFVDGERLRGELLAAAPRVLRLGDVVLVPLADLGGELAPPDLAGAQVIGERLRRVYAALAGLAGVSPSLYFRGESGSGKELAARELHRRARPHGPFVAVNCAAIPESLAEALLFGARRGAFSGAVEASEGYLRAAHGGVLFLDEIAELSLALQAKLLRALETRSVVPVGETRSQPVDLQLCVATHHDLRAMVRAGRFREDLYYRIGRPQLELPPLRQRREDLPWVIAGVLAALDPALRCDARTIEACALRTWPGNLRELVTELRVAAQTARLRGRACVERGDLAADAGLAISASDEPTSAAPESSARESPTPSPGQIRRIAAREAELAERRPAIEPALRAAAGNVSVAARALGVHRTQLRRWLVQLGLGEPG
jgi:transcriptional regulator with PAS, ATPase and Fis domain